MKNIFFKSFIAVFVFIYGINFSLAQNTIAGRVVEGEPATPVEYASVVLKNRNDSIIAGAVTDKRGVYRLKVSETGGHVLHVSFIGYKSVSLPVEIKPGLNSMKTPVVLIANSSLLGEATVTASLNERQSGIEKTRINTSASISSPTGSITEILKSAAMVSVDNNNTVYIRGNSNVLVLIDGVPTTLGALDGMPASATESIEIITNPDAKYDAEGTGGIINVITKKKGSEGFSLHSTINWGVAERVNGDLMAVLNTNGWNLALNYSGKFHPEEVESSLLRHFHTTGNSIEQNISSHREDVNNMLSATVSRNLKKDERFSLNIKFANPKLTNRQTLDILNSSLTDYDVLKRENDFLHDRRFLELSADYKFTLKPNVSGIVLKSTFSRNRGRREAYYKEDGVYVQKSNGGGYPQNFTLQADHNHKFKNKSELESGLKFFYRGNDFKFDSYQKDGNGDEWLINDFFSSDLFYQENIYSAYSNYSGSFGPSLKYKAGFRVELSKSELNIRKEDERLDKEHLFLAPFALVSKSLSESSTLDFSFSRRVTRPVYMQINPFVNMIDKSVYETGNRDLIPETISQAEAAFSCSKNGSSFNVAFFYSITKDFITQISSHYGSEALMLTYVNGEKSSKVGLDLNSRIKLASYLSISASVNLYYGETNGQVNGYDLSTNKLMWSGNLAANVKPSAKSDFSIQYYYNSPAVYPQFEVQQIHYMNASYKRELVKNKLTATVSVTDLFDTRKWNIVSDNAIYSLDNKSKEQSRIIWVGLTFNFNKRDIGGSKKNLTGDEPQSMIKLGY